MQDLWNSENTVESPDGLQFQMISFTLDPQWCGMLFSIYCRHEKASVLGADAFSTCSLAGPPLDTDWIAFAGSIGIEICHLSSTWALILETVKASGVILLLGVGSLMCYKLYHYYRPGSRSGFNSPNSSPPYPRYKENFLFYHVSDENQLIEDLDDDDISSIEGHYFGPSPLPSKTFIQHGIDMVKLLNKSRLFSSHENNSSSHSENGMSCEDDGQEADISEDSQIDKISSGSSTSSRRSFPLYQSHNFSLSKVQRAHSGMHRKLPKENSSSWLMKRLQLFQNNILPTSCQDHKPLSHSSSSLPVTPGWKLRHKIRERRPISNWEESWKIVTKDANTSEQIVLNSDLCSGFNKLSAENDSSSVPSQTYLVRDESFDSLGYSGRLPREGSFDSTCSEFSLDLSLPEATGDTSTMMCLDNLQHEIDQLKNHCLMMDEEFETIKCNRNLPGMSSLMKVSSSNSNNSLVSKENSSQDALQETLKQENARACFAGLYSLTTIKNSTSSEMSDSFTANGRASIGSAESLVWDSPVSVASPVKIQESITHNYESTSNNFSKSVLSSKPSPKLVLPELEISAENKMRCSEPCEDELMASLEWDEEALVEYSEDNKENGQLLSHFCSESIVNPSDTIKNKHKTWNEEKQTDIMIESTTSFASSVSERSSRAESSGFESKLIDSTITEVSSQCHSEWDQSINPWNNWASEESGYLEWDNNIDHSGKVRYSQNYNEKSDRGAHSSTATTPFSDYAISEATSPVSNFTNSVENVGKKVNIFKYAVNEWQGQTQKAETIIKGYAEIPSLLGVEHLRRIRGDNYCGVRAAIFQILCKGLTLPSSRNVFKCLSYALHNEGCKWLQNWTFAERLPYEGSNVLHGMKTCLDSLDNMVSTLSSSEDKEETLVSLLNSNPSLDLHIMEAVKLHMLLCAMKLHQANSIGTDVPLFAMLMFARDSSETPRDFMNNHLKNVGNTGGLEQIEMFLMGYALGVTLRVVRPAAHGTEDFICYYPDSNVGVWPEIILVAEDDRHYNVLVK